VIAGDQEHHVRHKPIDVPKHAHPFNSDEAAEIFSQALEDVKAAGIIPRHLGVQQQGGLRLNHHVANVGLV
ncbi:hypothetical protein B0H14DRAFT_2360997, partial [Mycena olivaceomarginata]